MSWFASIDIYCERLGPHWWAEPLNALSNLAFLWVAWVLWRSQRDAGTRVLAGLIALIGLCSAAFHISGMRIGALLDVGAIALFILVFLQRFLQGVTGLSLGMSLLGVLAFVLFQWAFAVLGSLDLNGSEAYLPPGLCLAVLALWSLRWRPAAWPWLSQAVVLFTASLLLRTVDNLLCSVWSFGTHFGWHLLNAAVLYCCVRGQIAGRA